MSAEIVALIAAVVGLIGALGGAALSSWMYIRHEKKKLKFDTLRRLASHRYDLTGPDFSAVLNEVIITYADEPNVLAAVQAMQLQSSNERLLSLFRQMADAVDVDHSQLSDLHFLSAFNIAPGSKMMAPIKEEP